MKTTRVNVNMLGLNIRTKKNEMYRLLTTEVDMYLPLQKERLQYIL